ncbi:ribosomal large subunit pseudouridine synthase E [Alteromonadaceae bacterium Bs31]|nr:ribosomal large subunit pseudouridine synthase E [Alteromonadaceae bacterium Bs31]
MAEILLLNKPFNCLSQFSDDEGRKTLADVVANAKLNLSDFYPAGRLDFDSEGLLLLTNHGQLQHRISNPFQKMEKTYWAQVEGQVEPAALERFRKGLSLNDGPTKPAKIQKISPPLVWQRRPPIRSRKNTCTEWLEIKLTEGRNRQVRRMTAAIGHPTLRLIRVAIGHWQLGTLQPGEFRSETVNLPKAIEHKQKRKKPKRAIKK